MRIDLRLALMCAVLAIAAPASAQEEGEASGEEATTTEGKDYSAGDYGAEDYRAKPDDETATAEATAAASSGGYPIAEIARPLVLPPMMLEVRGGITFTRFSIDLGPLSSTQNIIGLFAGAGFGIMDGLEAGIGGGFFQSGPGLGFQLLISPEFDVGDLPLYGMYDLTKILGVEGLELAGRLTLNLPLRSASDFGILADAPAKYHVSEKLAIIGSAGLGTQLGDFNGLLLALNGGVLLQATEQIAASATIGMLAYLGDGSTVLIPLSLRGEYAVMEFLDVFVDLSFVDLNNMGIDWFLFQAGAAYRLPL